MFLFNSRDDVLYVLRQIGERLAQPAEAVLYGGCAVILMGRSGRNTDDLDLDCRENSTLLATAKQVAGELNAVADLTYVVEEFIDVPPALLKPHERYGQFGLLTVYLCDPAIIAASKMDRRSEQDVKDVQWLLSSGLLEPERFKRCVEASNEYEDKPSVLESMQEMLGITVQRESPTTRRSPTKMRAILAIVILAVLIAIVLLAVTR